MRFKKIPNSTHENISSSQANKNVVKENNTFLAQKNPNGVQCPAPSFSHKRKSRVSYWPNRRKTQTGENCRSA